MSEKSTIAARIAAAKACLPDIGVKPKVGLILGSGLGAVADAIRRDKTVACGEIEGLVASTAPSHKGALIFGTCHGVPVMACEGRVHLYEGHSALDVAMPVYLMASLGVQTLIVTNAAGGLNPAYEPGSVVMISDHINMTGHNPLTGVDAPEIGVRFPDMSRAYDQDLRALVQAQSGVALDQGVYVGITGPSLETSAERRFFASIGGDMIGMSTVIEVIAANHCALKVLGLSVITNKATGRADQQADSLEAVLAHARVGAGKITAILEAIIATLAARREI